MHGEKSFLLLMKCLSLVNAQPYLQYIAIKNLKMGQSSFT